MDVEILLFSLHINARSCKVSFFQIKFSIQTVSSVSLKNNVGTKASKAAKQKYFCKKLLLLLQLCLLLIGTAEKF